MLTLTLLLLAPHYKTVKPEVVSTVTYKDLQVKILRHLSPSYYDSFGTYYIETRRQVGGKWVAARQIAYTACFGVSVDRIWMPAPGSWHILLCHLPMGVHYVKIYSCSRTGVLQKVMDYETRGDPEVSKINGKWTLRNVWRSAERFNTFGGDSSVAFPLPQGEVETRQVFDSKQNAYIDLHPARQ